LYIAMNIQKFIIGPNEITNGKASGVLTGAKVKVQNGKPKGYVFTFSDGHVKKILSPDAPAAYSDPTIPGNGEVYQFSLSPEDGETAYIMMTDYWYGDSLEETFLQAGGTGKLYQPAMWRLSQYQNGGNNYNAPDGSFKFMADAEMEALGYARSKQIKNYNNPINYLSGYIAHIKNQSDGYSYPLLQITALLAGSNYYNSYSQDRVGFPQNWFWKEDPNGDYSCGGKHLKYEERGCTEASGDWYGSSCAGDSIRNEFWVMNDPCPIPGTWSNDHPELIAAHHSCGTGKEIWGAKCNKVTATSECPLPRPISEVIVTNDQECPITCGTALCDVKKMIVAPPSGDITVYIKAIGFRKDSMGFVKGYAFEYSDGSKNTIISPFVDKKDTDPYMPTDGTNDTVEWIRNGNADGGYKSITQYAYGTPLNIQGDTPEHISSTDTPLAIKQWSAQQYNQSSGTGGTEYLEALGSDPHGRTPAFLSGGNASGGVISSLAVYYGFTMAFSDGNLYPIVQIAGWKYINQPAYDPNPWGEWGEWDLYGQPGVCNGTRQEIKRRSCKWQDKDFKNFFGDSCNSTGKSFEIRTVDNDPCPGTWSSDHPLLLSEPHTACWDGQETWGAECLNGVCELSEKPASVIKQVHNNCNGQWDAENLVLLAKFNGCGSGDDEYGATCIEPVPGSGGLPCDLSTRPVELEPVVLPCDGFWSDDYERISDEYEGCGPGEETWAQVCVEPQGGGSDCNIYTRKIETRPSTNSCDGYWSVEMEMLKSFTGCGDGNEEWGQKCIAPIDGGAPCDLSTRIVETRPRSNKCDGYWNPDKDTYTRTSDAYEGCGDGKETWAAVCMEPALGGAPCDKSLQPIEERTVTSACDGRWSTSNFDLVSLHNDCGPGEDIYGATCIAPTGGGAPCDVATRTFDNRPITNPCDGVWSSEMEMLMGTEADRRDGMDRWGSICIPPTGGGAPCDDKTRPFEYKKGGNPIDGAWSNWIETKPYTGCEDGLSEWQRTCTNPQPAYGGAECVGESTEMRSVTNDEMCPVQPVPDMQSQSQTQTQTDSSTKSEQLPQTDSSTKSEQLPQTDSSTKSEQLPQTDSSTKSEQLPKSASAPKPNVGLDDAVAAAEDNTMIIIIVAIIIVVLLGGGALLFFTGALSSAAASTTATAATTTASV
jgi:hypothetical protein